MPRDVTKAALPAGPRVRLKVALRGAVQGVGFRPFVHRLATELGLTGWVSNSAQGVLLEVENERGRLEEFLARLQTEKPAVSFIQSLESTWLDAAGFTAFEIRPSDGHGDKLALVLPDIATCPECRREILDPANRRFRYPFTNCTNCGPRFTIIEALPYDRANTAMKGFVMCPACQAEYDDPRDRRFHAQPNACPVCGPHLEFWEPGAADAAVSVRATNHDALLAAVAAIRAGKIVAVKGLCGFHLMVDARNGAAVQRLRERKHREEKPFALLFPTLESVRAVGEVSAAEARLLGSPEAPIVLLGRKENPTVALAEGVAPGNPNLGIMLPANPLHLLLLAELAFPVVATSGNLSDEPLCTDEQEAVERLRGIADGFLVHNRPIVRHVDDSLVRVVLGREMVLRRARGYAPLPLPVPGAAGAETILAVGAHLKNTVALAVGENAFVSQHIGDLETVPAENAFRRVIADLQKLYGVRPTVIAADMHPDYVSTRLAQEIGAGARMVPVQHHVAHVLACVAENEIPLPALGVAWDGTGYGLDGTIWGGEFFLVTERTAERVASLRRFRLPGGDAAVKEPRRAALGLLFQLFGDDIFHRKALAPVAAFSAGELAVLRTMLNRGVNSPWTSSIGRWFDAVAALTGRRQQMRFEGQAAMDLEFAAAEVKTERRYDLPLTTGGSVPVLDWAPTVAEILRDVAAGVSGADISARFHNALAEAVVAVARRTGMARVALSGGCFQNRRLLERTVGRLQAEGFQPYWHQRVPPNDGGIALGQVLAAVRAGGPK